MGPEVGAFFEFLSEVHRRPEPFAEDTARELWTDPPSAPELAVVAGREPG